MSGFEKILANKQPQDTKIMVAMSGGIDSSTVAAYLHTLGYQVIGVTLQLYSSDDNSQSSGKTCCAGVDIFDAKQVAAKFGFLHYVMNMEATFKREVIEEFADSYLRGETPIPCINCNQSVKFRDLLKIAKNLNVDALATGHYVRRIENYNSVELHKAVDLTKDQSYFLFSTTKEQLEFLRFPLGAMSKDETRELARHLQIPISEKPESQDICFVKSKSYVSILDKLRPGSYKAGNIVDLNGNILGEHSGIVHYTVGQRKGLKISSPEPLYVVKIDTLKNEVIVGKKELLTRESFNISNLNWLGDEQIPNEFKTKVKIRSGAEVVSALIKKEGQQLAITLCEYPSCSVAPGQACVIYNDTRVLGGGWIQK